MFLTMMNTLRRRRSVPADLFYAYWRDTHVGVACRLPGIDTLWTHWVDFEHGREWPAVPGVDADLAEALRFEGVPEPSFATPEDLAKFGAAMGPLMSDEANIFERTIGYQSLGENTFTLKQETGLAPNGVFHHVAYLLFIRQRPDLTTEQFRAGVRDVADQFAAPPEVLKVRGHLLETYDDTDVFLDADAEEVSHGLAATDQHQAVLEIAFADAAGRDSFCRSAEWRQSLESQMELFQAVHPFRVMRSYTWKLGGKVTLAGLRGAAVVDQVRALKARNQVEPETLALFQRPLSYDATAQLDG